MRATGRRWFPYVVAVLGAAALVYAVSFGRLPPADFTFVNGTELQSIDPAQVTGAPEGRIINALFEGLLRQDPKSLKPIAGIAELPELRVTFDSGNPVTAGESAADAYRGSADHVVHAHFKDWKASAPGERGGWQGLDGNWRVGEVVGEGQVDDLAATALMLEHGYDGYVDFEYEGVDMSPEAACRRGIPRMREWFENELP